MAVSLQFNGKRNHCANVSRQLSVLQQAKLTRKTYGRVANEREPCRTLGDRFGYCVVAEKLPAKLLFRACAMLVRYITLELWTALF
jgi:hypothetical protein